jgi:(5-formylfuran-3-yl)methyl phosphate synthase
MGRLLVSVRGPNKAAVAVNGGAHVADVEFPSLALGTPYPLNIKAVRERLNGERFPGIPISTNIGGDQPRRSTACQAALGVALAGADYVKCGLAGLDLKGVSYIGWNVVCTVTEWFPEKKVYAAAFPEEEFSLVLDPLSDGPALVAEINCHGLLVDTYHKDIGKGLLDYYSPEQIAQLVAGLHNLGREAWIAGSVSHVDLPRLWRTGVDVICVRGAACEKREGNQRFGAVRAEIVADLVATREGPT